MRELCTRHQQSVKGNIASDQSDLFYYNRSTRYTSMTTTQAQKDEYHVGLGLGLKKAT